MYAHKIADLFTRIGYSKKSRAVANYCDKTPEEISDFIRQQKPLAHKLYFLWAQKTFRGWPNICALSSSQPNILDKIAWEKEKEKVSSIWQA